MQPTARPRIKICCIASATEAWAAIQHGASAVGLVSAMPSGPGVITEEHIAEIAERIPPAVGSFLLTSAQDVATIVAQQRRCRTNTLQLVDALPAGAHEQLRGALPGIALVQVIHVVGPVSIDEAMAAAPHVHALLLDSGNPALATKELGGTGRVHDWAISAQIRARVDVPVFLAGGLRPDNVGEAIRRVRPFGIDLCSGVRTDGRLDTAKLAEFVAAAAAAA
jgi:phosphoribosylanthranilate isomerase